MLFDKIVHGPILQSVITQVGQLAPQDAAKLAVSLVDYYQRNPVDKGIHADSAGIVRLGEEHHILPKSDGGTNHPSNMVVLPVSQHFYVHVLLARSMFGTLKEKKYKMMVSAFCMSSGRSRVLQPEEIVQMRVAAAQASSEAMLGTWTFTYLHFSAFCLHVLYFSFGLIAQAMTTPQGTPGTPTATPAIAETPTATPAARRFGAPNLAARGSMCQVIAASLNRPMLKKGKGMGKGRRKSRKSRSWLQKGGRIFFERLICIYVVLLRGSRKGKVCAVTRAALSH